VWRTIDDGYWSDHIAGAQTGLYADVAIQLLLEPVDAKRIHDDPLLSGIEVLRDPFVANPTVVSPDEERALLSLSGIDPVQPAARP
jgi:hypothetical protein